MLLPMAWLYQGISYSRKFIHSNSSQKVKFNAYVIVVGNITVGGTGKTPFCIWLAQKLLANDIKTGIVSRGYKRKDENSLLEVNKGSAVAEVGDEPLLIKQNVNCPIIVCANRVKAIRYLEEKYMVDVVIMDDGLQHYKAPRDYEIAVVDSEYKFGNQRLLPAGPLRESVSRLKSCNLVVNNGIADNQFCFELQADKVFSLTNPGQQSSLHELVDCPLHAIAGIGNPSRFFNLLKIQNLTIVEHVFPDHYLYQLQDLEFEDRLPIIMTEKDAVKCINLIHGKAREQEIWVLPVSLVPNEALSMHVNELIKGIQSG